MPPPSPKTLKTNKTKKSSPSPRKEEKKEAVPPPPANFTDLLMAAARSKQLQEEQQKASVSTRTPVKTKIKRLEEKARASGASGAGGKGRGTPGRRKGKDKVLSPRQKKIKDFFENKILKVGGTGLSSASKATTNIQGTINSPLKGVLDICTPTKPSNKGGTRLTSEECGGMEQVAVKKRVLRTLEKWSQLGEKPPDSGSGGSGSSGDRL